MNPWTKFFLILLRLAIGWHLLFAGIEKFQPGYKGSEGYLQNSAGPVAPFFHTMIGDRLADKLTGGDASQLPPALEQEWNDYIDAFSAHYNLTSDQREAAKKATDKVKEKAAKWLKSAEVTVKDPSPYGPPAEVSKTVSEWVKDYQAKRQKVRDEARKAFHFTFTLPSLADNTRDQSADKAEVSRIRAELTKGLDELKNELKGGLRSVLTEDQLKKGPLPEPLKPGWTHMSHLDWIDFGVRWGLVVAGAGLILGLFTRLSCLVGAALLLSFYLAVPPWPGSPELFHAEGFPYINKNIVEMLALLTLATTRSGRWAGVDGLLYYLNPFRRKTPEPRQVVPGRIETFTPYQVPANESARTAVDTHGRF